MPDASENGLAERDRALLEEIHTATETPRMLIQLGAASDRDLAERLKALVRRGLVEIVGHPKVVWRYGDAVQPVPSARLTAEGRAAIGV